MPGIDAILFFVGGALTLGAGLLGEWYREASRTKRLVNLFKQGLREDLTRSVVLYDELLKNYAASDYVSYAHTQAIQDTRSTYDRNRDVLLFLDAPLRQSIVNYYLHSWQGIADLVGAQQRKDAVDKIQVDIFAGLMGTIDPTTGQQYIAPALQAAVQARMTPADILQRTLAMTFLKNTLVRNIDILRKEANAVLKQL